MGGFAARKALLMLDNLAHMMTIEFMALSQ
jgi:hypothetical protein